MKTRFIEATNVTTGGFNWGKFMLAQFEPIDFAYPSAVDNFSLIAGRGWTPNHVFITDLQTGEGALFRPGGLPSADLLKHAIWVCPMFEPFLEWFYLHWPAIRTLDALPALVELTADSSMAGYRRPGPSKKERAARESLPSQIPAPSQLSEAAKRPFTSFVDLDSVTYICPCGARVAGQGTAVAAFLHTHLPHTNGWTDETITDDGARILSSDSPRRSSVRITSAKDLDAAETLR